MSPTCRQTPHGTRYQILPRGMFDTIQRVSSSSAVEGLHGRDTSSAFGADVPRHGMGRPPRRWRSTSTGAYGAVGVRTRTPCAGNINPGR